VAPPGPGDAPDLLHEVLRVVELASNPREPMRRPGGPAARSRSRCATSSAFTIAAMGFPRRVIRIASPASAALTHSEKWAFASATEMLLVMTPPRWSG